MKSFVAMLSLVLLFAPILRSEDGHQIPETFVTVPGKSYYQAKLKRVEASGIIITHQKGISRVPFLEIPPAIREDLGMDIDAAFAAEQEFQAAQKQLRMRQAAIDAEIASNKLDEQIAAQKKLVKKRREAGALLIVGEVTAIFPEGVIVTSSSAAVGGASPPAAVFHPVFLVGHPQQNTFSPSGIVSNEVECLAIDTGELHTGENGNLPVFSYLRKAPKRTAPKSPFSRPSLGAKGLDAAEGL